MTSSGALPSSIAMTNSTVLATLLVFTACADASQPELRVGSTCPATVMREVNDHWIATHADPGNNKWARAVYFTGNMAAYDALREPRYAPLRELVCQDEGLKFSFV